MIAGSIIASIESAPDATQLGAEKTEDDKEEAEADYSEEAAYMNGKTLVCLLFQATAPLISMMLCKRRVQDDFATHVCFDTR
jgi:hypothetical protein